MCASSNHIIQFKSYFISDNLEKYQKVSLSVNAERSLKEAVGALDDLDPDPDPVEIPEHLSGFDLSEIDDDRIIWHGVDVPSAPAIVPRDETVEVEIEVDGSKTQAIWAGHGHESVADGVLDVEFIIDADDHERAVQAAIEWMQDHPAGQRERVDPDTPPEELPWYTRRYLSGAWGRYKGALSKGHEAAEAVQEYAEIRREGKEAAAEINEIRRQYGQEPFDFEGVPPIEELPGMDGELVPEDIDHEFRWKPYDPTDDVNEVIA